MTSNNKRNRRTTFILRFMKEVWYYFPENEEFYPELISPYALSKLAGEYYCRIFSENFGLETVCLRYFNVYGPRQALDDEYAVVIPKFIHCILNDQPPPIFGNGKQSRDFTYVGHVVRANLLAMSVPRLAGEVINIGCGRRTSLNELLAVLKKIFKSQGCPVQEARLGDVRHSVADIQKARTLICLPCP